MQQTNDICGQAIVAVPFISFYLHFQHVNSTQVRILNKEEDFALRLTHLIDNKNNEVHFQNVLLIKYPNLDFVSINCIGSQMPKCHMERDAVRQGNLTGLNSLQILNDTQPQAGNHSKKCILRLFQRFMRALNRQ